MQLRKFNDGGNAFREILENAKKEDKPGSFIVEEKRLALLQDNNHTVTVDLGIHMSDSKLLSNRLESGQYLHEKLGELRHEHLSDKGLWAWLSLFFFEQICPDEIGEIARYIPNMSNFQKYYRHLLYAPFVIYREYKESPEDAMAVLCQPVHKPGDVVEALAARQELIANPIIMKVATKLYFDFKRSKIKVRAAGKDDTPGSSRRFVRIMKQFDLTYDLYEISPDDLIALLPSEFDEFRP